MFSHVFVGVADFERALAFYDALMGVLGIAPRFVDRVRPACKPSVSHWGKHERQLPVRYRRV